MGAIRPLTSAVHPSGWNVQPVQQIFHKLSFPLLDFLSKSSTNTKRAATNRCLLSITALTLFSIFLLPVPDHRTLFRLFPCFRCSRYIFIAFFSTSAVSREDLNTRAIVFCVTSSCMVFLLLPLLLYIRQGGTYSL